MTEKVGGAGSESPRQTIEYIFHTLLFEKTLPAEAVTIFNVVNGPLPLLLNTHTSI